MARKKRSTKKAGRGRKSVSKPRVARTMKARKPKRGARRAVRGKYSGR
jgi:hypothetical protein